MEDVLALYEKPLSEAEPVVCIDEKPVVLHADLRPSRPLHPGQVLRRDCEYERRGTANAFCGVEPKAGRHYLRVTPDRSSPEFADYLLEIAEHYPAADAIHLVMDNLSSHTRKAVVERYGEKAGGWLWDRFRVHYTPKHGSWLNQAEIEISLFSRQCLGRRRIPSLGDLRREARAWGRRMNRNRVTIDWRFTRKKARLKFGYRRNRLCGQRPSVCCHTNKTVLETYLSQPDYGSLSARILHVLHCIVLRPTRAVDAQPRARRQLREHSSQGAALEGRALCTSYDCFTRSL